MSQWFFVEQGQRKGPVSVEDLAALVRVGTVTGETLVWSAARGGDWLPARQVSELSSLPFAPPPPPPAPGPAPATAGFSAPGLGPTASTEQQRYYAEKCSQYTEEGMRSLFLWYWILIGPLLILCLPAIAGIVLGCILLYRHWALIQDGHARTTPGQAVGFSFIPLFNYYWQFVAVHGLAQDMNAYLRRNQIAVQQVSEPLALATCILTCCAIIPYLGLLAALAALILRIIVVKQVNDAAIAILRARKGQRVAA